MMWWRVFDHVSFAIVCFGVVVGFAWGESFGELLLFFLTGLLWTAIHSREFSKRPDYRRSTAAKCIAAAFYILTLIGILYLNFAPAGWRI